MTIRPALLAATATVAALSLAACGGSSTATGGQPSRQASGGSSGSAQPGTGGFAGRNPGTSGKIAAITGKTLQVQNQTDGQVAVTYTAATTITVQVAATLADVKVGSCVLVTPVLSASGAPAASAGGTGPVAAGTVRISQPTDGDCLGGFGTMRPGGAAGAPSGVPTIRPSGGPSARPGGRGFGFGASGKVTAVSASGFTVASRVSSGDTTVTVSGSTTYTTTRPGTSAALKVGTCVAATGRSSDTGAVAADRLVVSDPVDGSCDGFGFRRGTGGQGGQGGHAGGAA